MSDKPVMILVYAALAGFFIEVACLFYRAYIRDRHKW